jgi:hypothetical protein
MSIYIGLASDLIVSTGSEEQTERPEKREIGACSLCRSGRAGGILVARNYSRDLSWRTTTTWTVLMRVCRVE